MARVDPHFERIARRLTTLQLRPVDDADGDGVDDPAFVRTYSAEGIRTVIHEYGLDEKLAAQGLADYELHVTEEDPWRHRLELKQSGDGEHIMDLRLHLSTLAPRGADAGGCADVVVVEWLLMQNPRREFTRERPRLPGQRHPGTGMGRDVAQLLVIMCRRIGRQGLVVVPERYHLAELYRRGGWLAPDPQADALIDEVEHAGRNLSFAARAWAMERGFVVDDHGAPVCYHPVERVLPVEDKLAAALSPGGFLRLARLWEPRRRLSVDVDALRKSLVSDPVEGLSVP